MIPKNDALLPHAKRLRREMTPQEHRLWYGFLRKYPVKIYRQRIIGDYIVDFYCASAKLVIEVDGGQHNEETGIHRDESRDRFLSSLGLEVLRINNLEVNRYFWAVCELIDRTIRNRSKTEIPPIEIV